LQPVCYYVGSDTSSNIMNGSPEDEKHVRYISLVRKDGGEPIIGIPYREMSVDPDLVASFVLAVIIFENRQLRRFVKEGYIVLIEEGEHVVGLLILDKVEDEEPFRKVLAGIIEKFETDYSAQLTYWRGDIRPFREFALYILGVYPYRRIDWELVPHLLTKSEATPDRQASIPWSVGKTDRRISMVIAFINGKRTMAEIMDSAGMSQEETMAIMSMLDRYNWVTFSRKITEKTVLTKLTSPPRYLIGVYGDQLLKVVDLFDGGRTVAEVSTMLPYSKEVLLTLVKNLVDSGVLGFRETTTE